MQIITEFWWFAWYFFSTVLDILNDESVNSTFINKELPGQNGWPKIGFEYKLGWNSVHGS